MSKPTTLRSLLPLLLLVLCALSTLASFDVHTSTLNKYKPTHRGPPSSWHGQVGTVAFSLFESDDHYDFTVTGFVTFTQESHDTAVITGQFNTGFDESSDPSDFSFLLYWHGSHYIWLDLDFEIVNGGTSPFQYHKDISVEELVGGKFFVFYRNEVISVEYIEKV